MNICFAGVSTRDKIMFMSYLGLILASDKKVLVKTDEKHFFTSSDTVFFGENLSISTKEINADIVIRESKEKGDMNFFVYDLLANFPRNRRDSMASLDEMDRKYIFLNNINYSKINKKYLVNKFDISEKNAYFLALDEGDISRNIENCFEETLSIRGISKAYKNVLLDIAGEILESDARQSKRLFKLALRAC